MKIAVISDIHGNMDAFDQVLEDIDKSHVDSIISLGDNIGYGPEPEKVIRKICELECAPIVNIICDNGTCKLIQYYFNVLRTRQWISLP